jgi:hypothetical protein
MTNAPTPEPMSRMVAFAGKTPNSSELVKGGLAIVVNNFINNRACHSGLWIPRHFSLRYRSKRVRGSGLG